MAEGYNIYDRPTRDGASSLLEAVPGNVTQHVVTGFANSSIQHLHVKAECACGIEDIDPVAGKRLVKVVFDESGNLTLPVPNPVRDLRGLAAFGGALSVKWSYDKSRQPAAPTRFDIYVDGEASPSLNASHVAGKRHYSTALGTFSDGQLVTVRVVPITNGGTNGPSRQVSIRARAAVPDQPASPLEVEVSTT